MSAADEALRAYSALARQAEQALSDAVVARLHTFTSPARDDVGQSQTLERVSEALAEVCLLHARGSVARSLVGCVTDLDGVTRLLGAYEHDRVKGLLAGLAGEVVGKGRSSGAREDAWREGCSLGARLRPSI